MFKMLKTQDAVIRALGGPSKTARVARRSPAAVTLWRDKRVFPANTYFVITHELDRLGCFAPRTLWDFEPIVRKANGRKAA